MIDRLPSPQRRRWEWKVVMFRQGQLADAINRSLIAIDFQPRVRAAAIRYAGLR